MSDGGDGFGEVLSNLLGAKARQIKTVDAAHQKISATWWWEPKTRTAIIESARVIGLAMLPPKKFHPFQLDTFGLGAVLLAAKNMGAQRCLIGIGGSATNDGGFGLARALGWKFFHESGEEISEWWQLCGVKTIVQPRENLDLPMTVAVDVQNRLLGKEGCSRVYGPQKGLQPDDFCHAENCLGKIAEVMKEQSAKDCAKLPGSGAAGGLGFGLMTFAAAKPESGFEIFASYAGLEKKICASDLVITGEGALDQQTLMGKGVGQVALLCKKIGVPCVGLAGVVTEPEKARKLFAQTRGLVEITDLPNAKSKPGFFLEKVAALAGQSISGK